MRKLILLILTISFASCGNEQVFDCVGEESECVRQFREAMSITSELNYPDDCQTTFELWEGDGGVYFLGCPHCGDCESIPLDCSGEYLHATISPQEDYFTYLENSEFVKVVGYIE